MGQALQSELVGHELLVTDADSLDITRQDQVHAKLREASPDFVINAAAYTAVDKAEEEVELAYRVNETGPRFLAQATSEMNIPIMQISTDYVFDGESKISWHESDETRPLSVYGKSKLAGEQVVQHTNPKNYIVRTAWLYHYSGQNFLRTMYGLREREEVRVVNDQRGSPTNADDLARAIGQLMLVPEYGIYHLVNQGEASWYELTCEFYRQLDIATRVVPVSTEEFPRPAPRPKSSVLMTDRKVGTGMPDWQSGVSRLVTQIRAGGW